MAWVYRSLVVAVLLGVLATPPVGARPAYVSPGANASQTAYAQWLVERPRSQVLWTVAATRFVEARTWSAPEATTMYTTLTLSATRSRKNADGGLDIDSRYYRSWELAPTQFFFDPAMERTTVTRGSANRELSWSARGAYEPGVAVVRRRSSRVSATSVWGYADAGNAAYVSRRARVRGKLVGIDLARTAESAALVTWHGSYTAVGVCLIDRAWVCD